MEKRRPDIKLSAKAKADGTRVYFGAAWKSPNGKGYNLRLENGAKIVLADGTEITGGKEGTHYLDVYLNDTSESKDAAPQPDTFDDIGF